MRLATLLVSCALAWSGCERRKPAQQTAGFAASPGWVGPGGKRLSDEPFRRTKHGFGAALYLITDGEFFDRWDRPSPGATYQLNPVGELQRNQRFYTALLFSNALPRDDGVTEVSVDMTVLRPDGTVYASIPGLTGAKAPRGPNDLKLADSFLKITIEDKDPLGEYRVRAVVHDKVRGVSIPLEARMFIRGNARDKQ